MNNYINTLNKNEQKLFQKVLGFYPTLKPRYYKFVINKINESKLSNKSKEKNVKI